MSRPPRATDDPFEPVRSIVAFFYGAMWAFVGLALLVTIGHAFGRFGGVSVYELGGQPCVSVNDAFDLKSSEHLLRGTGRIGADSSQICIARPTWAQSLAASTEGLLGTVEILGGFFLVRRVIRAGRGDGLFAPETVTWLTRLGWFLFAMSVITPVVSKLAKGLFVSSVATPHLRMWSHWWAFLASDPQPEWTMLIVGLGVVSFARIMHKAVALQEEAALTV